MGKIKMTTRPTGKAGSRIEHPNLQIALCSPLPSVLILQWLKRLGYKSHNFKPNTRLKVQKNNNSLPIILKIKSPAYSCLKNLLNTGKFYTFKKNYQQ